MKKVCNSFCSGFCKNKSIINDDTSADVCHESSHGIIDSLYMTLINNYLNLPNG